MTKTQTLTSLDDLATELDVTRETIETLAGQINDDANLYDTATERVTADGADLIRQQLASGWATREEILDLAADFHEAQRNIDEGKAIRAATVRLAREMGASWQQIANAFGLASREHARRIANENR